MNWIKYLALCLPLTLVLVGCTPKDTAKTESTETTETTAAPAEDDAMKSDEATGTGTTTTTAPTTDKAMEKTTEKTTTETKKAE
jgi:hypothetical protein